MTKTLDDVAQIKTRLKTALEQRGGVIEYFVAGDTEIEIQHLHPADVGSCDFITRRQMSRLAGRIEEDFRTYGSVQVGSENDGVYTLTEF